MQDDVKNGKIPIDAANSPGTNLSAPLLNGPSVLDIDGNITGEKSAELDSRALLNAADADLHSQPAGFTSYTLNQIMPKADAERWSGILKAEMALHDISSPEQQAAFLAQIAVESGQLLKTNENLNYSAKRLTEVWPGRFPSLKSAQPYTNDPEALGNYVYANRLGNGNADSGDGYKYRGGGLIQVTGRKNYRAVGFEDNPDSLREDQNAASAAADFWVSNGLNGGTGTWLNRSEFDAITQKVNGGQHGATERWDFYLRAQKALGK